MPHYSRILILSAFAASTALSSQLVLNGTFDSGLSQWTALQQPGSDGAYTIQSGTASPSNGITVPAPPGSPNAAMADAQGPGSRILIQDILIPASLLNTWFLRFDLFILNSHTEYIAPADTLAFDTPALNQQFRADIIDPAADPFTLAPSDIWAPLYVTQPTDPLVSGYQTIFRDVDAFLRTRLGQTVRLRFAQADNVNVLITGIDNVSISPVPEPAYSLGLSLVLLLVWRIAQSSRPVKIR